MNRDINCIAESTQEAHLTQAISKDSLINEQTTLPVNCETLTDEATVQITNQQDDALKMA